MGSGPPVPGFRAYILADTHASRHQDSLLTRLPPALPAVNGASARDPKALETLMFLPTATRPEGLRVRRRAHP